MASLNASFRFTPIPLLVLAVGCASGSGGQLATGMPGSIGGAEIRVDETAPAVLAFPGATVDDVWKALPATFRALGIPASVMDATAHIYGNARVTETTVAGRSTRDLFRCGDDASISPSQYRVQFGISGQPRKAGTSGVELYVQTTAFGRFVSASRTGTTHCVSNGEIEKKMKEQIDIQLALTGK